MSLSQDLKAALRQLARRGLFGLAIRDGLRPALVGTLAGLALSLATTRLIASQLYAVKPWDPALHTTACAAVLAISFLACAIPLGERLAPTPPLHCGT